MLPFSSSIKRILWSLQTVIPVMSKAVNEITYLNEDRGLSGIDIEPRSQIFFCWAADNLCNVQNLYRIRFQVYENCLEKQSRINTQVNNCSRNQRYGSGFTSGKGTFSYEKGRDACTDLRIVRDCLDQSPIVCPIKIRVWLGLHGKQYESRHAILVIWLDQKRHSFILHNWFSLNAIVSLMTWPTIYSFNTGLASNIIQQKVHVCVLVCTLHFVYFQYPRIVLVEIAFCCRSLCHCKLLLLLLLLLSPGVVPVAVFIPEDRHVKL